MSFHNSLSDLEFRWFFYWVVPFMQRNYDDHHSFLSVVVQKVCSICSGWLLVVMSKWWDFITHTKYLCERQTFIDRVTQCIWHVFLARKFCKSLSLPVALQSIDFTFLPWKSYKIINWKLSHALTWRSCCQNSFWFRRILTKWRLQVTLSEGRRFITLTAPLLPD